MNREYQCHDDQGQHRADGPSPDGAVVDSIGDTIAPAAASSQTRAPRCSLLVCAGRLPGKVVVKARGVSDLARFAAVDDCWPAGTLTLPAADRGCEPSQAGQATAPRKPMAESSARPGDCEPLPSGSAGRHCSMALANTAHDLSRALVAVGALAGSQPRKVSSAGRSTGLGLLLGSVGLEVQRRKHRSGWWPENPIAVVVARAKFF